MGTRRSRHNKGRKPEKHHSLASVVCRFCFLPFFQLEQKTKLGRGLICPVCTSLGHKDDGKPQAQPITIRPRHIGTPTEFVASAAPPPRMSNGAPKSLWDDNARKKGKGTSAACRRNLALARAFGSTGNQSVLLPSPPIGDSENTGDDRGSKGRTDEAPSCRQGEIPAYKTAISSAQGKKLRKIPGGSIGSRHGIVRRATKRKSNLRGIKSFTFQNLGTSTDDKEIVLARLEQIARLIVTGRHDDNIDEMVNETFLEILEKEAVGVKYSISQWAYWMAERHQSRKWTQIYEDSTPFENAELLIENHIEPNQIPYTAALETVRLIKFLPNRQREVALLLCDGASVLEISNEVGEPLVTVLNIMRDIRTWLGGGGAYLATDVTDRITPPSSSGRTGAFEALNRGSNPRGGTTDEKAPAD